MNTTARRPNNRALSAVLALTLALTVLAITPRAAQAHDSCAIEQPVATGVLGTLLSAVNVFSSFLEAEPVACTDKYEAVRPRLTRDWGALPAALDPFDPDDVRPPQSNAPRTFAPCVDGMAADFFPCDGVDMMSHVSHEELGTTRLNDIWGWTDGRRDYALVGATTGTVFVDITDARRPQVLGILPTASAVGGDSWRDIKVYDDHAFVVSEHINHGVQVFDLTRLRDWDGTYTTYAADARYTGHGSAHNIHINEATGFAYSVGAGPNQGLTTVVVDPPSSAAGSYNAIPAAFGAPPPVAGTSGAIVLADDGSANPTHACSPLIGFPAGAIALVDRGTCTFVTKVANAQAAGASAVIVANSIPGAAFTMGGSDPAITIPAVMVTQADGAVIRTGLPATGSVAGAEPPPSEACGTGLHIIDISSPTTPTFAGCFDGGGYVHDTQCVVYSGADADHQGREICLNSNGIQYALDGENYVSIVDVTDKSAPVELSRLPYEGSGYSHQGWMTEDQRWFLHGDEGDEILAGVNTTTRVWDISDLDAPFVHDVFVNDTASIDHNLYTEGRYAYASNYTTGLRVYDTRDVATSGLSEVGFFDLYPENDNASFEGGTWSNFPYLRQGGVVAVSSIDRGLFILRPRVGEGGG